MPVEQYRHGNLCIGKKPSKVIDRIKRGEVSGIVDRIMQIRIVFAERGGQELWNNNEIVKKEKMFHDR